MNNDSKCRMQHPESSVQLNPSPESSVQLNPSPESSVQLNPSPVSICIHYNCYKNKRATYEALKSFRASYPSAPIRLISDGGLDFGAIAHYFKCDYLRGMQTGDGRSTRFSDHTKAYIWLQRLIETGYKYDTDYIVILEDDVLTRSVIRHPPTAAMMGPCTMPFSVAAQEHIRTKWPDLNIHGYSGCGGTILERSALIKCMMFDFDVASKLDARICEHSDALLTWLFLWNGFENRPWADHSEISRGYGDSLASFDHQYKKWYDAVWDDSLLTRSVA